MNNKILQFCLLLGSFFVAPSFLWATHNRAGEIHVQQIGPLTVRITIITWTKTSSINADRDSLLLCLGDGNCKMVLRSNGPNNKGLALPNDIKYNEYITTHTYAGPARYRIFMTDPNRNGGIVNVNPPSSDNVPFHIETIYQFQDPQFGGFNTTPFLLQPPVDVACTGRVFKHNPNAFDPDGDSLSYRFVVPLQSLNSPVPNYSFPNQIAPGANNLLQINEVTGDIVWNSPQAVGEYNLAFVIISWRNGVPIDTTIRDMQILVTACQNNPPVVLTDQNQYCVVAEELLEFDVRGTDPDPGQLVRLSALGGPFNTKYSPATFTAPSSAQPPVVSGKFRWQTTCEHIFGQPYSVVFKAVDSVNAATPQLADLSTVLIRVVGPPPEDVTAESALGEIVVTWEKPYVCEDARDDYFYGFSVWRREGSNDFPIDTCSPGLAGKGYTRLTFITLEEKDGRYIFVDRNVERGRTYCYRVLAIFAQLSLGGYRYNLVESLPSNEACVQLKRDIPIITHVSVEQTDLTDGQIRVEWTKPLADDLDTLVNPGPYRYQLLRSPGQGGAGLQQIPGASFVSNTFWQANTLLFTDQNLNTETQAYSYAIEFYAGSGAAPLGVTNPASSVFLSVAPTDNANILTWTENVPWNNKRYIVFRQNDLSGDFDSIASVTNRRFEDRQLINGKSYCYYVRSVGSYNVDNLPDPLLNDSQIACGTPIDDVPPCAPLLEVRNVCTHPEEYAEGPPYVNELLWNNPNLDCPDTDDVLSYNIWYAPDPEMPLNLIAAISGASNTRFSHKLEEGLAGCYAISAVDSVGNSSPFTNRICVDNCPVYVLPNVFTPNGDGANDTYRPFPGWRFVERIELQVFNRWGNLVFTTSDPAILWDGTSMNGSPVSDGTYFYVCKVFERRVTGVVLRDEPLKGYIEVIR
ncbi:MAG: gliding motility-associated C-terminal domain-containing protein [Saprospiraceae bacterium]